LSEAELLVYYYCEAYNRGYGDIADSLSQDGARYSDLLASSMPSRLISYAVNGASGDSDSWQCNCVKCERAESLGNHSFHVKGNAEDGSTHILTIQATTESVLGVEHEEPIPKTKAYRPFPAPSRDDMLAIISAIKDEELQDGRFLSPIGCYVAWEMSAVHKRYAVVTVGGDPSGHYSVLKAEGGRWTELFGGQDYPSKSYVDELKIPDDVQLELLAPTIGIWDEKTGSHYGPSPDDDL